MNFTPLTWILMLYGCPCIPGHHDAHRVPHDSASPTAVFPFLRHSGSKGSHGSKGWVLVPVTLDVDLGPGPEHFLQSLSYKNTDEMVDLVNFSS